MTSVPPFFVQFTDAGFAIPTCPLLALLLLVPSVLPALGLGVLWHAAKTTAALAARTRKVFFIWAGGRRIETVTILNISSSEVHENVDQSSSK
jgi:hypothetical protein